MYLTPALPNSSSKRPQRFALFCLASSACPPESDAELTPWFRPPALDGSCLQLLLLLHTPPPGASAHGARPLSLPIDAHFIPARCPPPLGVIAAAALPCPT